MKSSITAPDTVPCPRCGAERPYLLGVPSPRPSWWRRVLRRPACGEPPCRGCNGRLRRFAGQVH